MRLLPSSDSKPEKTARSTFLWDGRQRTRSGNSNSTCHEQPRVRPVESERNRVDKLRNSRVGSPDKRHPDERRPVVSGFPLEMDDIGFHADMSSVWAPVSHLFGLPSDGRFSLDSVTSDPSSPRPRRNPPSRPSNSRLTHGSRTSKIAEFSGRNGHDFSDFEPLAASVRS